MKEKYILGIDTGGTNTDTVILREDDLSYVCSGKAPTTHDELFRGIEDSLETLDFNEFASISAVHLSTTLATNAVVEGKGGKVGLILAGFSDEDQREYPAEIVCRISGKLDIRGNEKVAISEKEILNVVLDLKDKVDAIAISCYASVRNPVHEMTIKRIVEENTDIPVFCAHELSDSLGFYERTVTAVLNAGLLHIVRDLLISARDVLEARNIHAPVSIIRSNGTLMTEKTALQRPVDMILSGPAASILGARHLTGISNAFILDMGGTTTDIAYMKNSTVKLNSEGASVGGWQVHCCSVDISTHGIGGDSRITVENKNDTELEIHVGPNRILPACRTAGYSSDMGITPTDLSHASHKLKIWDNEKSESVIQNIASQIGHDYSDIIEQASNKVIENIVYAIVQSVADFEHRKLNLTKDEASAYLMKKAFTDSSSEFLEAEFTLKEPIIAIGGPVDQWLPHVAKKLQSNVVIPEYFQVANAIGAAIAEFFEEAEAIIRPVISGSLYTLYLPDERLDFSSYEEACRTAEEKLDMRIKNMMAENGIQDCSVEIKREDHYTEIFSSGNRIYIETIVSAKSLKS